MIAVGKYFILHRQIGAAGIDEVNAGQAVLHGDVLRAQVFFDRHGKIRAAFDGGIVGDEHAFVPLYTPDAGDDACRRHTAFGFIHTKRRQGRKLQKR